MNDDVLAKGEKVITERPATQTDINAFMQGDSYQPGGRHDFESKGMGSGVGEPQLPAAYEEPQVQAEENIAVQSLSNAQEQDWKKLYGQSENEKGEWRKTASETMNELQQLKNELAAMRNGQAYQPGPNATVAAPPQPPPQHVSQDALPETYFPNKSPDDIVEVKDVDAMVRNAVAPAVLQLHNQQVVMYQQQLAGQKAAAGLTPVIEQRLMADNPWLNQVPEGAARIQAMQRLASTRPTITEPTPRPEQKMVSPTQAASRRVTYVESNNQRSQAESQESAQERIAKEFYSAKSVFEERDRCKKWQLQAVRLQLHN
jgi:hypothetical protein